MSQITIQLHWQDRPVFMPGTLVAEESFDTAEAACEWAAETAERRKDECPDGWGALFRGWRGEMCFMAKCPETLRAMLCPDAQRRAGR